MAECLIGEYLVVKGIITRSQLEETLKLQEEKGGFIGDILVKLGYATEEKIICCLSRQLRIPYVDLKTFMFRSDVVKLIPEDMAWRYNVIPLSKIEGVITVAMSDPLNLPVIDKIQEITNCEVQPVFATRSDIHNAIYKFCDVTKKTESSESAYSQATMDPQTKEMKTTVDSDIRAVMNTLDNITKDISKLKNYLKQILKT